MEKDVIKKCLMDVPCYDADWIENAAAIIFTHADNYPELANEEFLATFTPGQLVVIKKLMDYACESPFVDNSDISKICCSSLNATQMQLIFAGLEHGLTMGELEPLMDPCIPYSRSNFIIKAMLEGHKDAVQYINFNTDQVYEIYAGLVDGVNVSAYAYEDVPSNIMGLIRHCMNIGMDASLADAETIIIKRANAEENTEAEKTE